MIKKLIGWDAHREETAERTEEASDPSRQLQTYLKMSIHEALRKRATVGDSNVAASFRAEGSGLD